MRRELHYYDIFPKVVQTEKVTTITVKILEKRYLPKDGEPVTVKIIPMTQIASGSDSYHTFEAVPQNGTFTFSHLFTCEQEYGVYIHTSETEFARLAVYALENDLYALTPLKGDFHVHSTGSDGREMPEAVMAYYRQAGYDFTALTDHYNYTSSLQAKEFYKDVKLDFNIIEGEEVHVAGNNIHAVNFGGEYSVNSIFRNDKEKYETEVSEIIASLDPTLKFDSDAERFKYASCIWVFKHIRKANGLAIFPHPHWNVKAYHVRDSITKLLFKSKCFDAFELIGGQTAIENNMQLAFYYTAVKEGYGDVPVVSCSDSHGTIYEKMAGSSLPGNTGPDYPFTDFYTIVFAASNTKNDIITAVKNKNTAAIETYANAPPRVHGDYRMVSYAMFLISEYFPLHAELCYEEGRLMRRMAYHGDTNAEAELNRLSGRVGALVAKYFGRCSESMLK